MCLQDDDFLSHCPVQLQKVRSRFVHWQATCDDPFFVASGQPGKLKELRLAVVANLTSTS